MEPGEYQEVDFIGQPTKMKFGELFLNVKVTARLVIERNIYFGYLPLLNVSGFHDDLTGELILRELTTDVLNTEEVEKNWKRIDATEDLAVTPVISFLLYDHYGNDKSVDGE